VGLNDYQSPYALWCEKRGITPEFEGNLRTRIGTELEPVIARLFEEETGKKVQNCNFSLVNDAYPWAIADVDRMVVGEDALLEIKSTSALNLKHYKNGDYPARFYVQVMHYLAVTGKQKAYLAVLIGNSEFKTFEIERDESEIEALMATEKDFYGFMESGNPPPIDGSESTREAILAQQGETPSEEPEPADLSSQRQMLDTLMELESAIAQMEEQRDGIKNQLIQILGSAWYGNCEGYSISYKPQVRKTFDWKKLQKSFPQIDLNPFFKSSASRPLSIKRIEKEVQ
jgi:putative phage-type endonuclease